MKEILKKLKVVLGDVEISEDAVVALDSFLKEITENAKAEVSKEFEEYKEQAEKAFELFEADCEAAFALFESDCEQAFALFESDAEKAFDLFEEHAEKAFDLFEEETQETFTKDMAVAIEELYKDIEKKAREEFLESGEFKILKRIKDTILPLVESDSTNELRNRINELESQLEVVNEEKSELEKTKLINTLCEDIPEKYVSHVKAFIEKATDVQGIYDRYETILEMMETDVLDALSEQKSTTKFKRKSAPETKPEPVVEDTTKETEPTPAPKSKKEEIEPVLESVTVDTKTKEDVRSPFSAAEKEILAVAGLI